MDFFTRLFKKAPADDALWNMLNDRAVHYAIDNDAFQFYKLARIGGDAWNLAMNLSDDHVDFTDALAPYASTAVVTTCPLEWQNEPEIGTQQITSMQRHGLPVTQVSRVSGTNYRYVQDDTSPLWVTPMNPKAVNAEHGLYIKNDNSIYSPLNRDYFVEKEVCGFEAKTNVFSGFFAEICIPASNKDALKRGKRTIIDPAQCYKALGKSTFESVYSNNPHKTIITEPGQIAHVVTVYGQNKAVTESASTIQTISPLTPLVLKHTG